MRKSILGALCALALSWPLAAASEPLTIDTLLGLETLGRIAIDPTGRIVVFEEMRARSDLPRYDLQPEGARKYARLYRYDLASPSGVRPLLPMEADAGYTTGPFSPDGSRLVVFRLQGLTYRLGIVDLATDAVTWTDLSPEVGAWGRSVEWISSTELVVLGMPDGSLPPRLGDLITAQTRLPGLWAQASRGEAAFVTVGVGAPPTELQERRLWRVEAESGRTSLLAEGPFLDFEASPDGRHVALLRDGPTHSFPGADATTEFRRERSLSIVDVRLARSFDPPEAVDVSTSLLAWSGESDALLVTSLDGATPRLLSITPTGVVNDLTPPIVTPMAPLDSQILPTASAGWLGPLPVVRGVRDGREGWHLLRRGGVHTLNGIDGGARLVSQGRNAVLFASRGRIVRVSADGRSEDLGQASTASRPDGPFGHRGETDAMKAESAVVKADDGRLCRATADPGPETCVTGAAGAAVSWDRGLSVARGPEGRASNRIDVRHGASTETIWTLNPELDEIDPPIPHLVTGPRGARGWLYLPATRSVSPPPVIVIAYPGKTSPDAPRGMQLDTVNLTQNGPLLLAAGYAVLYPDLPSTEEPSLGLADRILAVVDAAAATGSVDPDRIGLWGHSFGAWAVVLSASQSERFKAVVAVNGSYNLPAALAAISPHERAAGDHDARLLGRARWLEAGQAGMLRSYWTDPERYRRGSAFERADKITAPVLLVSGEMDYATAQADLMYAALRRLNRPVALTYLFGEDHSIHNPGNARIYYQQVLGWFDRHLREGEPGSPE